MGTVLLMEDKGSGSAEREPFSADDLPAPSLFAPFLSIDEEEIPKKARSFLKSGSGRGATGTQQRQATPVAVNKNALLLPFLTGSGTDMRNRTHAQILEWDYEQLERCHDYIQWLFPTDERSRYNVHAPKLTRELQQSIRGNPKALESIKESFHMFLDFLGLEVARHEGEHEEGVKVIVRKAPQFDERVFICWTSRGLGNHNWLRISRVLLCLKRVGLDTEAAAFLACLERLYEEGVPCGNSIPFWRQRAAVEGEIM